MATSRDPRSRARVRTCSAPARRDLDAGRGHGVGGSARGERPTSRVHVVETLSELYRARARALVCRCSLAVTAFLREWLIFLLHQSRRVAAPSDNFHAALSNLEKPARRIASRSRSTNHLRSACAMNAPDVWVTDSLAPSAEITRVILERLGTPTPAQYPTPRRPRAPRRKIRPRSRVPLRSVRSPLNHHRLSS